MKSYSERTEATREKIKTYQKSRARRKKIISIISLCACLLIAFNLVMFVPYTTYPSGYIDLSVYKSSEYYDIIKEISYIQYGDGVRPERKNNFQRITENLQGLGESWGSAADDEMNGSAGIPSPDVPDASEPSGSEGSSGSSGERYEETTDNQVAGVTEGDLIKRTNKYIYYLSFGQYAPSSPELRVYPIASTDTQCIAEFSVSARSDFYYYGNAEMYLNQNGDTVTLVLPTCQTVQSNDKDKYYSTQHYYTEVLNIDVSDHSDIKVSGRYLVSGRYVSSRLVGDELLLVTNYSVDRGVDFSDEEQFVPQTGTGDALNCIPASNLHCPQKPAYSRFTVVCTVDARTLEETGSEAFLSYSQNVYVSENNIYLTNGYNDYTKLPLDLSHGLRGDDYHYVYEYKTEISRVEYGGELDYKGSFTVDGEVINRFCMDENDGIFRVVTSPHRYEYVHGGNYYNSYLTDGASLYCLDIETYEAVGKLENFAPSQDTVRSARFDGDKVYVCTAVVLTDPVFAIDLSDYNNITFVDTGEISGYSIALRKFYGDTLLGIGYDGNGWSAANLKIELYKETGSEVESVAAFTYINYTDDWFIFDDYYYDYAGVQFSTEYKAYFIDAERGLVGLGLTVYAYDYNNYTGGTFNRYIMLQYDGQSLNLLFDLNLEGESDYYFYNLTRGVYTDGVFYLFTQKGLYVNELNI